MLGVVWEGDAPLGRRTMRWCVGASVGMLGERGNGAGLGAVSSARGCADARGAASSARRRMNQSASSMMTGT